MGNYGSYRCARCGQLIRVGNEYVFIPDEEKPGERKLVKGLPKDWCYHKG